VVVEGAKPCGGDALFSSAGAVDGEKPGGGDTLASFSAAVEGANPGGGVTPFLHQQQWLWKVQTRGGGGGVLSLINKLWDVEFLAL
jgi:hypothetical protein